MKRFSAFVLVFVLTVGLLAGCGKSSESTGSSAGSSTDETVVTDEIFYKGKIDFITDSGESVYRVVRPDDEASTAGTQYLFKQLKKNHRCQCP